MSSPLKSGMKILSELKEELQHDYKIWKNNVWKDQMKSLFHRPDMKGLSIQ